MTNIRARASCSPRAEALASRSNGGGAGVRRGDDGGLRLRKKTLRWARTGCSREGEGTPKGVPSSWQQGEAHRGTGRGTGATAAVEQAVGIGGRWQSSLFARAEWERGRGGWAEGANERGEVGEQGAGPKRGAGARAWPENARSWARPRRGDRGRKVIDGWQVGMAGQREGAGAGKRTAPIALAHRAERGRGRAQACADRRGSPVRHRGRAGAGARAGLSGPTWAKMAFSISREFLIVFLFIFSRVFQFKSKSSFKFKPIQIYASIQRMFRLNMMQHSMTHRFWAK
jgi:hypothetical protein